MTRHCADTPVNINRQALCRYAYEYKLTRLYADLPMELTLRWHRTATAFASHEYYINRVYILPSSVARIMTIITLLEESRPANTRL